MIFLKDLAGFQQAFTRGGWNQTCQILSQLLSIIYLDRAQKPVLSYEFTPAQ